MALRMLRAAAPFALAAALATACIVPPTGSGKGTGGSSGTSGTGAVPTTQPPELTSVDMSASAAPVNGTYTIFGSLTYTDADDVVVTVQVYVPVIGKTYSYPVADPVSSASGEPFQFTLSADVPLGGAGPTRYTVTLVNKSGAASQPFSATVDLQ